MIASLEGTLLQRGQICVVKAGGLGLAVSVSESTAATLPSVGENVRFWTHLSVRDDGWTLYGFPDPDELTLFRLMISVSGIGPKLALGMLSGAPATAIAHALHAGDEKRLKALPGIGPKSAARMVVELGQKIPAALLVDAPSPGGTGASTEDVPSSMPVALELLGSMGLSGARAEKVLRDALSEGRELADDPVRWVRAALRRLT